MRTIDLAYRILWATIEEHPGLWEILWEVNMELPNNDVAENRKIAMKILKIFVEHKIVEVYLSKWGHEEMEVKKSTEAVIILEDLKNWIPPTLNEPCVKLGNTEKGEKSYSEKRLNSLFLNNTGSIILPH